MKRKAKLKLKLARKTVRLLTSPALKEAAGAMCGGASQPGMTCDTCDCLPSIDHPRCGYGPDLM